VRPLSQARLKAARIASMSAASASDFENGMGNGEELLSHFLSHGFTHRPKQILAAASRVFMNVRLIRGNRAHARQPTKYSPIMDIVIPCESLAAVINIAIAPPDKRKREYANNEQVFQGAGR
jgi:hypothetical protein